VTVDLDAFEKLLAAASPVGGAVALLREAYRLGAVGPVHSVIIPDGDKPFPEYCLYVAITGNGPHSSANARLIAALLNHATGMLVELARLRELEAAVLALDVSSGGDDVWDLEGSDEERRVRDACRAATEKHWPDCALNHGGAACDMGPDCGSDAKAEF
jgi:hypothetical protein